MTLDNFRTVIRAYVPAAKSSVIGDTLMDLLINKGVADINIKAAGLTEDNKFTATAEARNYTLSTVLANFVAFNKGGLWWNAGSASSPDWRKLDPILRESLNSEFPQWMNEDSDNPLRYIHEGNNLQIDPMPNTTLSEGFWAFYIKKTTDMTDGSHYPFSGSPIEIASLKVFDDAIIDYVRWKLAGPLRSEETGILLERDYEKSLAIRIQLFNRRLDISAHTNARMRGPTIGR